MSPQEFLIEKFTWLAINTPWVLEIAKWALIGAVGAHVVYGIIVAFGGPAPVELAADRDDKIGR